MLTLKGCCKDLLEVKDKESPLLEVGLILSAIVLIQAELEHTHSENLTVMDLDLSQPCIKISYLSPS